ncbi:DUF2809 domain-containing protein [Flavobacterium sp.]|uniref:ribosomal maturation YjgA family protein n=1 Tax=Flavobacterium sp. TaxID=239 RepID=UPI00374CDAA3
MLQNNRFSYLTLIIFTVILGIVSRKIDGIPTYFGDILYAIMVYFGMCFLFVNYNQKRVIILALLFCYCIEFLQIYRAEWIVSIRKTSLGHYILGQDFIWSDLVYYTLGIVFSSFLDFIILKKKDKLSL